MNSGASESGPSYCSECVVCGSHDSLVIEPRKTLAYSCCKSCGHCVQLVEEGRGRDSFERAQSKYYSCTAHAPEPSIVFGEEVIFDRISSLSSFLQCKSHVLEVGPGRGHIVEWLLSKGHNVTAVEHSVLLASELEKRAHAEVRVGEFESMSMESGHFDVFCSFHVIEHVIDPLSHLSKAYSLIRPGGIALIATPNARSWQQILFPSLSPNFDSAHLYVFSPASLCAISERAGWKVVKVRTPEFTMGWLRVLSKGLRRLREEDEETTAGKYSKKTSSVMNLVLRIIVIASFPVRYFQQVLGYGNEVLVVLRKPCE